MAFADDTSFRRLFTFEQQAALGWIPGVSYDVKFGINLDIDTGTDPEDIWGGGGTYAGQPTGSAETVEVFSSDAADNGTGATGALTVRLFGLDANGAEQNDDVTLSGPTKVPTIKEWTRVFRVKVLTAGSGGQNAGTLTVRHTSTTANIFVVMPIGANRSQICAFTVPAGKTALILDAYVTLVESAGAAGEALLSLRARESGAVYESVIRVGVDTSSPVPFNLKGGLVFPALTDIKVTAETVSANNSVVTAFLEYLLIDD